MSLIESFKLLILEAPASHLDESVLPLVRAWDEKPKAVQVLEVLDKCIYYALSSAFIIQTLRLGYELALKEEGKTHEQVVPFATWRHE